jgi:hypothetical protein
MENCAAAYSKLLKALVVFDVRIAQKAPIANMLFGKTWVRSSGEAIAMKMLPR